MSNNKRNVYCYLNSAWTFAKAVSKSNPQVLHGMHVLVSILSV